MFKLQWLSKYSPFDAVHVSRCFFHCSKQFLNSSILMPFSASAVFCFISSTLAKHFSLRASFHLGKQANKKSHLRRDLVNREDGAQASCHFWSQIAEHNMVWPGVLINHPSCSLSQQHQRVHWHRWDPRTFTYQGKPVLQGALPPEDNSRVLGESPLIIRFLFAIFVF